MVTDTKVTSTEDRKLEFIASRLHVVRLRRAIRYMDIDSTVAVSGGQVTRPKSRLYRYEVDGVTVKRFQGRDCVDRMLCYLGLETAGEQEARRERFAEAIGDEAA
jgi:hypothetical protein